jgi:integration host factor subunit beta
MLRSQIVTLNSGAHMKKLELIAELARKQGLSKAESARIIDIFFDTLTQELCNGGRVEIRGLCTFHVKTYPGYTGRNPRSGELVKVKPKKLPFFKCGTDLKKLVDR